MPSVFSTSVASRWIDREAVVDELRALARRFAATQPEVEAIYLFGSFATGQATPRSDADLALVVGEETPATRDGLRDAAAKAFLASPVPADLVFLAAASFANERRGVAGAVHREGIRLSP